MTKQYTIYRSSPVNLQKEDVLLFAHELKRTFVQSETILQKQQIIDSRGTWITHNKLPEKLSEKSAIYSLLGFAYWGLVLRKIVKLKFALQSKPVVWFIDSWSNGYFHWMLDALPRLYCADQQNNNFKIFLPHQFSEQEYILSTLKVMGFNKFHFMEAGYIYYFQNLLFQTHCSPTGNYHDETISAMRNKILENCRTDICFKGKRIYVSRNKASRRKVLNETEMLPVLEKYGFSIIHFEDYSWHEQVSICANAQIMIGLHGAGLTNMLFMPTGAKIFELRMKNDSHNNCYFSLASALGLNYYYLPCDTNTKDMLQADFHVDIKEFKKILASFENKETLKNTAAGTDE